MKRYLFTSPRLLSAIIVCIPAIILAASGEQLHKIQVSSPAELRQLFASTPEKMPLVSAHRGGAIPGYPENCIATFENTLKHAHSIMEIDLQYSSDGHIVLHHDSTLDRTTTGSGPVKGLTLAELKQLKLVDREGTVTQYRISTLDEAIEWSRGKTILILDRKREVPVEACVEKIQQHNAQSHVMIMAYSMEDIRTVHQLDPDIMMEVFMGTRERYQEFDETGVPWDRVIAFISHQPPEDKELINMIHAKGSSCMAGTSRYLDRQLKAMEQPSAELEDSYKRLLRGGIDIIETDLPGQVYQLLYK